MGPYGLLAALALALAACGGAAPEVTPTPAPCTLCVNLSGEGMSFNRAVALPGVRYSCRAEVSGNYWNVSGKMAEARARIEFSGSRLFAPDSRGEWREHDGDLLPIIAENAAVASGEARFAFREGGVSLLVLVEPRARWSVSCEPDTVP